MSHSITSLRALLGTGVALAAFAAVPAVAQDAPASEEQAAQAADEAAAVDQSGVADIVVTARRRDERLLDTPVAITAFTGEQLQQHGAIDITDVAETTPNVTLEPSRGTNSTLTAFIRGVGQQDPVPGFEAGIGVYLDDVYLNRPQAAVLDIYDVERIEVLRGPQGTLYGRNTIGGAIKYVTKRLPDDLEVKLRATYGSYDQADGVVSVSAPIGDMLKVGVAGARLSRGGFGDNLTLGIENYNKDIWAGRGTVEFESPDGGLFVRLTGDYTHDKSNARNGHRLFESLFSHAPVLDNVYDTRAGLNNPREDVEAGGLSMTAEAHLTDTLTLKSISAWRKDRSYTPIDFDALPSVDVDVPAVYRNEQTSQEFQLLYDGDRLHGIFGYYYLGATAQTSFDVILGLTGDLLGLPGLNGYTAGDVRTETSSFYGDFTYDLTDRLSVSLGGRYTWDERKSHILKQNKIGGTSPEFGGTAVPIQTLTDFRGRALFRRFTPRASVSFKPTPDHLVYASYAEGFKGGGFDPRGSGAAAPDLNGNGVTGAGGDYDDIYNFLSFDPESVATYEVGWKAALFDRRVTFAADVFYSDYKDVQIPGSIGFDTNGDGINDTFVGVTSNAGKATIKGVEFEGNAVVAQDFAGLGSSINVGATVGYIDAEYDRFVDAFGADVADERSFQNTPKWTASGTLGAHIPVGEGAVDASTTVAYRSETHQFEVPIPYLDQPGYALWDANLTYSLTDDRYSIGLHAKNILDKRYITSGYNYLVPAAGGGYTSSLGREGVATAFYGNPRQVFVTVGAKF